MLVGSLDFLWRPWGSIELWEEPITASLRRAGVVTKLVTDHPHLFETGGENYHVDFAAWDYQRGHEGDLWRTRADPSWIGAPSFGRGHMPYDDSRGWFGDEADFPGPRVMREAVRWLDRGSTRARTVVVVRRRVRSARAIRHARAVRVDVRPGLERAATSHLAAVHRRRAERGVIDERQARQVRAQYGGKLTMIDNWFGRLLDVLDDRDSTTPS